ncbi:MAG: TolC family protein [Phycisphaera sp.]|nr:TolC family protein [Phycisphaera sp.]
MTHNTRHGWILPVVVLFAAGCASPFDDEATRIWQHNDPAKWALTDAGQTHRLDTLAGLSATPTDNTEPLLTPKSGVDEYVALALANNPSILAAKHKIERLAQRVPQATSLDDPMFQVSPIGEMAQTAAGQVGLMTGVSQKIPFPGKLDTRGRIAQQDVAMATAELAQTRLRVAADTRKAYWDHYANVRAVEVMEHSRSLLEQIKSVAEAEYKAGTRTQGDVLRASVELANLENELVTLKRMRETSRAMLNQLMDRATDAPLPEPAEVGPTVVTQRLDDLLTRAAQDNPALSKAREKNEQMRQMLHLAKLGRLPDLTVGATYNAVEAKGLSKAANGKDQWWFSFGINLPIWTQKYDAAQREALRGMMESAAELSAEQNRVAFAVQEAYLRIEAQRQLVTYFEDTILPQARQMVEASTSGYRAGSVDFLTLVDNWRKLLGFEVMRHRAVAQWEQAAADLDLAVGSASQETQP